MKRKGLSGNYCRFKFLRLVKNCSEMKVLPFVFVVAFTLAFMDIFNAGVSRCIIDMFVQSYTASYVFVTYLCLYKEEKMIINCYIINVSIKGDNFVMFVVWLIMRKGNKYIIIYPISKLI